eukprot:gene13672-15725_t
MFARALVKSAIPAVVRSVAPKAVRPFSHAAAPSADVVIPELVSTLEWVLDSPPNVHQFDEPPIVVEIEHLKNLHVEDH